MINFDDRVNENKTEHNKNWPYKLVTNKISHTYIHSLT